MGRLGRATRTVNLISDPAKKETNVPLHKGAFTYDVRFFWDIFDLPTYPNQILYYISLFSKIHFSLTYILPINMTSYVNAP